METNELQRDVPRHAKQKCLALEVFDILHREAQN
jgi:hypothetical protein